VNSEGGDKRQPLRISGLTNSEVATANKMRGHDRP